MSRTVAVVCIAAACSSALAARAGGLSSLERRGRGIFIDGVGAAEIVATLEDGVRVAGAVLPCGGCHGSDGRGRREGGVAPSDITREALARPYDVTTALGRRHGPYDDRLLKRAIAMGIDAGGNRLSLVMPRYVMSQDDFAALAAFMRTLGDPHDPGVEDRRLVLGVVLPPRDALPALGDDVRAMLTAYFDAANRAGGIYGRRIDLVYVQPGGTPQDRADGVRAFLRDESPFALIGSFTDGAEREIAGVADREETPLLAMMTSNARGAIAPSRYVRDLVAGLAEQSRALVRAAALRGSHGHRAAVVRARDMRLRDVADATVGELREAGFSDPAIVDGIEGTADCNLLLFLDRRELTSFLASLARRGWKGTLLVPAAIADPTLFERVDPEIVTLVSFPMLPADATSQAVAIYEQLVGVTRLGPAHLPARLAALASAALTVDALRRAGRTLSRDRFLDAIDSTSQFRSGFVPPLTFGPTRRLGSTGSWVLTIGDPSGPVWIDPGSGL